MESHYEYTVTNVFYDDDGLIQCSTHSELDENDASRYADYSDVEIKEAPPAPIPYTIIDEVILDWDPGDYPVTPGGWRVVKESTRFFVA